jgi:hypothetical protein
VSAVPSRLIALAFVWLLAAGCRQPGEREAGELARLRDDAVDGIVAVETFCTARDSAIARVARDEPGAERILQEVLLAPPVIDDYCEEFRYHEHDEPEDSAGHAERPDAAQDSAAADTAVGSGR